ncbi:MAG: UDP-2,3-diacylglucosamine diphosphatase LpxI [Pseudomonadota bacterium]
MTAHEPDRAPTLQAKVGLIAGAGSVPLEIAEAVTGSGREIHVIALRDIADADFAGFHHTTVGLGQVGRMLRTLHATGCKKFIMSGGMERPNLLSLTPDLGFFLHLRTILGLMRGGDDTVLRKILRFFESQGFEAVGIGDIAPSLLAARGPLTSSPLATSLQSDAKLAFEIVDELSAFDIGQAIVVHRGEPIGIEAAEGTDGLLHKLSPHLASGGTLVKATKPNQELRADLPTIGPRTIEAAATLKLSNIAVEAGRSVIAQRATTTSNAEASGICIVGIDRPPRQVSASISPTDEDRSLEHRILNASPKRQAWINETMLAARVLSRITKWKSQAAVCTSRQRVLSIALGDEANEIVNNISQIRQWSDRSGRHRDAAIAFTHAEVITPSVLSGAADRGVRSVAFLKSVDAEQLAALTDICNRHNLELVDLS